MMHTRMRILLAVLVSLVLLTVGFGAGVMLAPTNRSSNINLGQLLNTVRSLKPAPTATDTAVLQELWERLHDDYVKPDINSQELVRGMMAGLVQALGDPYSTYFDPAAATKFQQEEIDGSFEGVGMEVGFKNNSLTVIAPLPDTPADEAGVMAGDELVSIDQQDTATLNIDQAVQALRGPQGTTVEIRVHRGSESDLRTFKIVRATIRLQSVTSRVIESGGKKIGYVRITSFMSDTASTFQRQTKNLLSQGSQGLIIDLRNNPGGLLDQAVKVASTIIPNGVIVSEVGRSNNRRDIQAEGNAYLVDERVVVLVNQGSASAAEIVAGALQDTKTAMVIGTKTFGKGTVQDFSELPDGSALKLTVAKWLTPSGRSIADDGIVPDVLIEPADSTDDPQLQRAIEQILQP